MSLNYADDRDQGGFTAHIYLDRFRYESAARLEKSQLYEVTGETRASSTASENNEIRSLFDLRSGQTRLHVTRHTAAIKYANDFTVREILN